VCLLSASLFVPLLLSPAVTMDVSKENEIEEKKTKISTEIWEYLQQHGIIDNSADWAKQLGYEHGEVVGAIKSLISKNVVQSDTRVYVEAVLTDEGQLALKHGTPEFRVLFYLLKQKGPCQRHAIIQEALDGDDKLFNIAVGYLMKNKWLAINKESGHYTLKTDATNLPTVDPIQQQLKTLFMSAAAPHRPRWTKETLPSAQLEPLKHRKLITLIEVKPYVVKPGPQFHSYNPTTTLATDLTDKLLNSGKWDPNTGEWTTSVPFKAYNFRAMGIPVVAGHLHPLLKVRAEFRTIFLELGFEEMPTNNFVESSFWNFDALFTPQQHPVRETHDTFFLSDPATTITLPQELVQRVREVHENGGSTESRGWRYPWSESETRKNILRTHTTAVSARLLYQLALDTQRTQQFQPKKYFSIDRVFRNEKLDNTHLAEFHQIEGLVADRGLTLANLIGQIELFFARIGIRNLRFKPAYNPYTEPSMEVFGWHPSLKKWVEIGNSGIFRPEMLLPMGLPKDVNVIAWGLSLERPTMIKYDIKNIRSLCGDELDLNFVRCNPICRLDKHSDRNN